MIKRNRLRRTKWYHAVVDGLTRRGYASTNEVERFRRRRFQHRSLPVTVDIDGGHQIVVTVCGTVRQPIVAEKLADVFEIVSAAELSADFSD